MKLHVYWLMSCQSQVIRQSLLLFNTSGLLQPRWQKKKKTYHKASEQDFINQWMMLW